jgi:hypothetical protein
MTDPAPTFKVYYTDVPLPEGTEPDLSKLYPLQFATRRQAVEAAGKIIKVGGIVWLIEEPGGDKVYRPQIAAAFRGTDLRFNFGPGPIIVGLEGFTSTSTGGMTHKQHKGHNVTLPPKRRTK